jgi:hypothetical protein
MTLGVPFYIGGCGQNVDITGPDVGGRQATLSDAGGRLTCETLRPSVSSTVQGCTLASGASAAHNPEVAGSNPAPATTQGSKNKASSATALGPLIICQAFVRQIPGQGLARRPSRRLRRLCRRPEIDGTWVLSYLGF